MDISCGIEFYFFQLGERNSIIGKLKDYLRSLSYLKNKPTKGIIFDASLKAALTEFQRHKRLPVMDGSLNLETYAALGKEMTPQQIKHFAYNDLVPDTMKWLLSGQPPENLPFIFSKKSGVEKSNGNAEDERVDGELARLLTSGGIIRAASAAVNTKDGNTHFRLAGNKVYTIHIYGDESGMSVTGIFLPKFLSNPKYNGGDTVTATTKTGEVLGIAHVRVSSQAELDRNYKSGRVNAAGSKYIGDTAGVDGDSACYRHSHLHFYPNAAARLRVKESKSVFLLADPTNKDNKDLLDVRELLKR